MNCYEYRCGFGKYIDEFIALKRAIGYTYYTQTLILQRFDGFCALNFPDAATITKEMMELWMRKARDECVSTVRHRTTPVAHLAEYMNSLGINAFIYPTNILPKEQRYIAYIYSDDELARFFKQTDQCHYSCEVPYRHLVMPVLFRTIYCCGLRTGEARNLKLKDVDLAEGTLSVFHGKHDNDRIIPMSVDLLEKISHYTCIVHAGSSPDTPFFTSDGVNPISENNLYGNFRRFLRLAGISHGGKGKGPRIYDFRHTFAVNCLKKLIMEGKDMNAYYPVLKTYMGHSFFKYTEYYLRLTKDMFPEISRQIEQAMGTIIPSFGGTGK